MFMPKLNELGSGDCHAAAPLSSHAATACASTLSSGLPGGYKVHCMHYSPHALHPVRPAHPDSALTEGEGGQQGKNPAVVDEQ